MLYFMSDTHPGHKNMIKPCSRPFSSVEEMDETIMDNWNRKVKKSDTVVVLGDIVYKSDKSPEW